MYADVAEKAWVRSTICAPAVRRRERMGLGGVGYRVWAYDMGEIGLPLCMSVESHALPLTIYRMALLGHHWPVNNKARWEKMMAATGEKLWALYRDDLNQPLCWWPGPMARLAVTAHVSDADSLQELRGVRLDHWEFRRHSRPHLVGYRRIGPWPKGE